jgi:DNA-binding CsgD family transcriptional regulator
VTGLADRRVRRPVRRPQLTRRADAAIAARLHVSQSAVEKHINAIFDKLGRTGTTGCSRRVLAVLRCLGS